MYKQPPAPRNHVTVSYTLNKNIGWKLKLEL